MKSAEYVAQQLEEWKKAGKPLMWIAWNIALLCVGWAYVYAALGQFCTPAQRKAFFKSKGADHPTIKSKCQVIRDDNPKSSCNGCKWYPGEKRTRIFDCRGFVYWILLIVYDFKLKGAGATSQWNTKSNWKAQGTIDTCPKDQMVVLYAQNKAKKTLSMKHTAFGWGNETIECAVGVQHKTKRDSQFTNWGIPVCFSEDYVPPAEEPKEDKVSKPTLKKGASGTNVKTLQKLLIAKGYSCGDKGADGKFGNDTLNAVKAFQKANGLKADGVVGSATWAALEAAGVQYYQVTVQHLTNSQADALVNMYDKAYKEPEKG